MGDERRRYCEKRNGYENDPVKVLRALVFQKCHEITKKKLMDYGPWKNIWNHSFSNLKME